MSGQCTGWVLRHGPKVRAMRAVLLTIADAANRDGEYAHPGTTAMCEGSLYSKAHVRSNVARLIDEGWLEITDHGNNGRGIATVYRVVMERPPERRQPSAPLGPPDDPADDAKGANPEAKGANPDDERRQSEGGAPLVSTVRPTGKANAEARERTPRREQPPADTLFETNPPADAGSPPDATIEDATKTEAHRLARLAMEQPVRPNITGSSNPYIPVMKLFESQLRAGVDGYALERAIVAGIGVWTTPGIQVAVAKLAPRQATTAAARSEEAALNILKRIKEATNNDNARRGYPEAVDVRTSDMGQQVRDPAIGRAGGNEAAGVA